MKTLETTSIRMGNTLGDKSTVMQENQFW
jgi:hypothetical protein